MTAEQIQNLPKPSKGRNLTNAQKIQLAEAAMEIYAKDENTLAESCKAVGFTDRVFYLWKAEISEISEIFEKAIDERARVYVHQLRARAQTALEKLVDGFTVEDVETSIETVTGGYEKKRIRKLTRTFAPNATAVIFALTNTDPENFKRYPANEQKDDDAPAQNANFTGFKFVVGESKGDGERASG